MDKSEEIAALLTEIRDHLSEGARRQAEMLEVLRAESAKTSAVADRSVELQEISVQRQKVIQSVALPVIGVCALIVLYLVFKHML